MNERILKSLALAIVLGGCAVSGPYVPRERNYEDLAMRYPAGPDFSASRAFREEDPINVRDDRFNGMVPAVVRKVFPNGNLFIEGHGVVLVNDEQQHFYISGVIRPIDIAYDNSVRSAYVADVESVFTSRGIFTTRR